MAVPKSGSRDYLYKGYRLNSRVVTIRLGTGALAEQRAVACADEHGEELTRIEAEGRDRRRALDA